ncbi:CHASE domain-containing protein [Tepidimonas sp.]|uniref:CHASE domain-containing protein n=1 Tax=Tepidimonas sp. TaxID=2002775 RepID=UPI0028CD4753|nr:CHASE domain-containing protein [Tepidimonas sp.]MDT7929490.1 CHASE domain-containing protein [Tepidimonas sp.]
MESRSHPDAPQRLTGQAVQRGAAWMAVLAVLLVWVLAAAISTWLYQRAQDDLQQQLQHEMDLAERRLDSAFERYGALLLATRAWLHAHPGAGWRDAREFVGPLELPERYPAASGLAFARRVAPAAVDDWLAEARTRGLPVEVPYRRLRPDADPERDQFVIDWIEPSGQERLIGLDIASDPVRWEAMQRAVVTGDWAVTAPLRLANTERLEYGLLLVMPVYEGGRTTASVPERWRQLRGFIVTGVPAAELVRDAGLLDSKYDWHWVDPKASPTLAVAAPGQPVPPDDGRRGVALHDSDGHGPEALLSDRAHWQGAADAAVQRTLTVGQRDYVLGDAGRLLPAPRQARTPAGAAQRREAPVAGGALHPQLYPLHRPRRARDLGQRGVRGADRLYAGRAARPGTG